jgi:hypothetical protein
VPSVLSAHNLLIAGIFVAYFGLMAGLGCYIAAQGQHRDSDHDDHDDQDTGHAVASLAA